MPALWEESSREILFSFLSVYTDVDSDGRTIDSSRSIWLKKRPRKFKSVIDSISIAYRTLLRLRASTILFHPSDSLVRISRHWLRMVNGLQWEDLLRWELVRWIRYLTGLSQIGMTGSEFNNQVWKLAGLKDKLTWNKCDTVGLMIYRSIVTVINSVCSWERRRWFHCCIWWIDWKIVCCD